MLLMADNLQITKQIVRSAVASRDMAPIQALVKECVDAGADGIDINPGPLKRRPGATMRFLVEAVQSVSSCPILLDTVNAEALAAGIAVCQGSAIINGISLEPHKLEKIAPIAVAGDADIIGYLLYPNGHVPPDAAERLNIAVELVDAVEKRGIDPTRLIIDPVIVPVAWNDGNTQAWEVLEVLRHLPGLLDRPVRTIGGLSNLTSGNVQRYRKILLECAYLPMLAASGLTMVLMNMTHPETVRIARACRALDRNSVFTWEAIL
ncbi:hypothetical protein D3OALGA1CA_2867 [Olavius algarvensis associated proteobacterium Delta 3]|nr:hypothetical protein D3OALGA1CA_2867 [Olavius algarvensis associated proteobacterium Delta 3]CAB5163081.1 hypothetical protein D3OALGB2SA_5557 [Olavius algarvensis associated proteobacterium Delta 3]